MGTGGEMYQEWEWGNGGSPSDRYLLPPIKLILSKLPERARVLDLGCGNGAFTALWARDGWEVTGIDLSESGIHRAKSSYPGINFHRMQIGRELVSFFDSGTFDAIVAAEVIEHLYAPRELTWCAFQLLKRGGLLVLTTPYNGYVKDFILAVSGQMDRHRTALWDGGHIKFWSTQTIRRLLVEAGFISPQIFGAGRIPLLRKSMVVSAIKPA